MAPGDWAAATGRPRTARPPMAGAPEGTAASLHGPARALRFSRRPARTAEANLLPPRHVPRPMYGGAGYGAGSTYGSGGMYGAGGMYSSNGMYGAGGGMYGGGYGAGGGLYGGGGYGGGGMYGRPMLGGYGAGMMPPPGESAGSAQQDWLRRPCYALSPPARDPLTRLHPRPAMQASTRTTPLPAATPVLRLRGRRCWHPSAAWCTSLVACRSWWTKTRTLCTSSSERCCSC